MLVLLFPVYCHNLLNPAERIFDLLVLKNHEEIVMEWLFYQSIEISEKMVFVFFVLRICFDNKMHHLWKIILICHQELVFLFQYTHE